MTSKAEENTFRALRDQDLLATSSWCAWGFHTWTKWKEPEKVSDNRSRRGYLYYQQRRCAHCNKYSEAEITKTTST